MPIILLDIFKSHISLLAPRTLSITSVDIDGIPLEYYKDFKESKGDLVCIGQQWTIPGVHLGRLTVQTAKDTYMFQLC